MQTKAGGVSAGMDVLVSALCDSRRLVLARPGHESLWYHRRCVVEIMLNKISDWKWQFPSMDAGVLSGFKDNVTRLVLDTDDADMIENRLREFCRTLTDDKVDDGDTCLLGLLTSFFESEVLFISCVLVGDVMWDQNDQRRHLQSYFGFVCSRVSTLRNMFICYYKFTPFSLIQLRVIFIGRLCVWYKQ